ncbi:hypothetical protein CLOBOL_00451 [Enterocloster bolteae ATCC BAA-613]|uniref:Uncharacterized protein n=1 Tax=Enterocloster bolteae (strain ATCC BAA-613 / DSM 15670 / CCUG 46953 / JCM 12243 / WAL 16351) TaxID=411902 RepID=A8RHM0_ENTBW|nr:hypothetical protein CLOBOL_00451 [Enterocloster bolteae ATCC BAA-613]
MLLDGFRPFGPRLFGSLSYFGPTICKSSEPSIDNGEQILL